MSTPEINISEWAKLQQKDEYCQKLSKRIEAETKQEAKRQAHLIEHLEFGKKYKYIIEDRKIQSQSENLEYEADQGVRS